MLYSPTSHVRKVSPDKVFASFTPEYTRRTHTMMQLCVGTRVARGLVSLSQICHIDSQPTPWPSAMWCSRRAPRRPPISFFFLFILPFPFTLLLSSRFYFIIFSSSTLSSSTSSDAMSWLCPACCTVSEGARMRDENEACGFSARVPDPFIRCAGRYVAVSIDLDPRPQSGTIYSLFGHLNHPPHITTASESTPEPSSLVARRRHRRQRGCISRDSIINS